MRWIRGTLQTSAAAAVVALLALNWRVQLQTQQKLDALAAALSDRPAEAVPAPKHQKPEPGAVTQELARFKLPPYVIEAPDQLMIEVVVKDPKTGATDRLPTQPISGQFLVRPDGTVGLGFWGWVPVAGSTLEKASAAIRSHIAKRAENVLAENLVVVVDVLAYHSKSYQVITDMTARGHEEFWLPLTGDETVVDAINKVNSLPEATGERNVKISRRTGKSNELRHDLPVDWKGITQHGLTHTNYQILPGDRIYVIRAVK